MIINAYKSPYEVITMVYQSPVGNLVLGDYNGRLCMCDWLLSRHHQSVINRLSRGLKASLKEGYTELLGLTVSQLDEYFAGKRKVFDLPYFIVGTEFQQSIWKSLVAIPYGATATYSDIASQINKATAVRAVANAVGANALSVIIPCHRVIGSDGSLTGYAGTIAVKKRLLDIETKATV